LFTTGLPRWAASRFSYLPNAFGAAFATLLVVQLWQLASGPMPRWRELMPRPLGPLQQAIVRTVESAKARGERVVFVAPRGVPVEVPAIDWDLATNHGWLAIEQSGAIGVPGGEQIANRIKQSRLPEALRRELARVATRGDSAGLVKTMYAGLPTPTDSVTFAKRVQHSIAIGDIDVVLLATAVEQTRQPFSWFAPLVNGGMLEHQATTEVQEERRVRVDEYRVRAVGKADSVR
jgi:hypothetical protein